MSPNLKSLWTLTQGQRGRYSLAAVMLGCATLAGYVAPLIVAAVIDGALKHETQLPGAVRAVISLLGGPDFLRANLWLAAVALTFFVGVAGVFGYFRVRLSSRACEVIIRQLRDSLYDQLQHVPPGFHDKNATGDLVQRCTSDVDTVRNFYNSQVIEIVDAAVRLVTVLPILLLLDWRMALAATAVLPFIVLFAVVFFGRVQGSFKSMDEAEGAMSARMQENLTGIRVVRAFARADFEIDRFAERNLTHRNLNRKLYFLMAVYWASSDFLCFLQIAFITMLGAYFVHSDTLSVGTYVAFMSFTGMYLWPIRHTGRVLTELGKTLVALGRINEVLNTPREVQPAAPAQLPARLAGKIEFRDVTFGHKETPVVAGVSFTVQPGQTIALLGPSGSGKSTLIALLLRLYDPQSGQIFVDDIDIASADRKAVRAQVGIVMQEPFLYGKTIRDNIRLGRFDAPESDILESASIASIHESIQKFESKYDTIVGERGVTLSGGQRQRVAIARALLKDAPILVLDDALSAVDTHTESDILGALRARAGRHTTILIAHRLSTLMHADNIFVLEKGRITQSGNHDTLVSQPGLYRNLWSIQSELEEDLKQELATSEA
jgi:ATP-binding cassette, subfamily B, bacterial